MVTCEHILKGKNESRRNRNRVDILIALSLCEIHLVLVNYMFSISICVCIISLIFFDSKTLMIESQPTKTAYQTISNTTYVLLDQTTIYSKGQYRREVFFFFYISEDKNGNYRNLKVIIFKISLTLTANDQDCFIYHFSRVTEKRQPFNNF